MATLFLAYADSRTNPLPNLREEDEKVNTVLSERAGRGDYRVVREQFATRDNLVTQLPFYQDDIVLFSFSGHAGSDRLLFTDGDALSDGVAGVLRRCRNLKLVILNGCSTSEQVDKLFDAGVPMVIATTAPIGDQIAKQFAIKFFTELAQNRNSVKVAFNAGVDVAKIYGNVNGKIESRAIGTGQAANEWVLYYQEAQSDLLDTWLLPVKQSDVKANIYLNNALKAIFQAQIKDVSDSESSKDSVLKRLPFVISEPIRKLLSPDDGSGAVFYDTTSPARFRMLLYAYRSIINFTAYKLIGQLWNEKQLFITIQCHNILTQKQK